MEKMMFTHHEINPREKVLGIYQISKPKKKKKRTII